MYVCDMSLSEQTKYIVLPSFFKVVEEQNKSLPIFKGKCYSICLLTVHKLKINLCLYKKSISTIASLSHLAHIYIYDLVKGLIE